MNTLLFDIKKLHKKYHIFYLYIMMFFTGMGIFVFIYQSTEPDVNILEDSLITNIHNSVYGESTGLFNLQDEENLQQYLNILNDINTWGTESNAPGGQLYMEAMERNEEAFSYLLEERIEPRYPLTIQISEYDLWAHENLYESSLDESSIAWDRFTRHRSHYDKGWYVVWYAIIENYYYVPLVVFVFLLSGLMTSEKTVKYNHLSFQTLEGAKKGRLFLEKYTISVFFSLMAIVILTIGTLSISLFYEGLGDLNYPVFYHSFPSDTMPIEISLVPLSRYLSQSFILLTAILIFIFSVTHTLGQFIKSELLTSIVGIGLIGIGQVLPPIPLSPFSFFNLHSIVSGLVSLETNTNLYTFETGVFILHGWAMVIFLIGIVIFNNKKAL